MEFTFLGTSSGLPTRERNSAALAMRFSQDAGWILFDCGEGTQHQLLQTKYSLPKLKNIFISHLHGDHCYGLFGLLATRSLNDAGSPINICAPKGIKRLLEVVFEISQCNLRYDSHIKEITEDSKPFRLSHATVNFVKLEHTLPSYAFVIREDKKPGRFKIEKAKKLHIPEGKIYSRLKNGEEVELDDGRIFDGKDFVGEPKRGRKVIIAGDNQNPELLLPYLENCDLLIHEATYTEAVKEKVEKEYLHSTAKEVAKAAEKAGVKNLVLTHFSARFSSDFSRNNKYHIDEIRQEAEKEYSGNLILAKDFMSFVLKRSGEIKNPQL